MHPFTGIFGAFVVLVPVIAGCEASAETGQESNEAAQTGLRRYAWSADCPKDEVLTSNGTCIEISSCQDYRSVKSISDEDHYGVRNRRASQVPAPANLPLLEQTYIKEVLGAEHAITFGTPELVDRWIVGEIRNAARRERNLMREQLQTESGQRELLEELAAIARTKQSMRAFAELAKHYIEDQPLLGGYMTSRLRTCETLFSTAFAPRNGNLYRHAAARPNGHPADHHFEREIDKCLNTYAILLDSLSAIAGESSPYYPIISLRESLATLFTISLPLGLERYEDGTEACAERARMVELPTAIEGYLTHALSLADMIVESYPLLELNGLESKVLTSYAALQDGNDVEYEHMSGKPFTELDAFATHLKEALDISQQYDDAIGRSLQAGNLGVDDLVPLGLLNERLLQEHPELSSYHAYMLATLSRRPEIRT